MPSFANGDEGCCNWSRTIDRWPGKVSALVDAMPEGGLLSVACEAFDIPKKEASAPVEPRPNPSPDPTPPATPEYSGWHCDKGTPPYPAVNTGTGVKYGIAGMDGFSVQRHVVDKMSIVGAPLGGKTYTFLVLDAAYRMRLPYFPEKAPLSLVTKRDYAAACDGDPFIVNGERSESFFAGTEVISSAEFESRVTPCCLADSSCADMENWKEWATLSCGLYRVNADRLTASYGVFRVPNIFEIMCLYYVADLVDIIDPTVDSIPELGLSAGKNGVGNLLFSVNPATEGVYFTPVLCSAAKLGANSLQAKFDGISKKVYYSTVPEVSVIIPVCYIGSF